jgi:methionyl aminopeptidase
VAHGIPGDRRLHAGDMVNIDVSAELGGYFGDTGHSFVVGEPNATQKQIMDVTQAALKNAIAEVRAGVPLNVIGKAIEATAKANGCSVLLNLGSHGVGSGLHEEPFFIPPYYDENDTRMLTENMVITIEPFISNGAWEVKQAKDGWTLYTDPEFVSAQYEHSMVVTQTGVTILTAA